MIKHNKIKYIYYHRVLNSVKNTSTQKQKYTLHRGSHAKHDINIKCWEILWPDVR